MELGRDEVGGPAPLERTRVRLSEHRERECQLLQGTLAHATVEEAGGKTTKDSPRLLLVIAVVLGGLIGSVAGEWAHLRAQPGPTFEVVSIKLPHWGSIEGRGAGGRPDVA